MNDAEPELQQRGRALYDFRKTILYASQTDPRFSYCRYVPRDIHEPGPASELIVSMHGTGRNVADHRDWFANSGGGAAASSSRRRFPPACAATAIATATNTFSRAHPIRAAIRVLLEPAAR